MRIIRKVVQCLVLAVFIVVFVHSTRKILFPIASTHTSTMSSSPPPLRLAILEADTPQPQANSQYGGYRGVFTSLLDKAYSSLDTPKQLTSELKITGHDVVNDLNSYPSLDDIDAVLISGSKHNSFDDDEWILKLTEFTRQALATNRIKIIGVCFGHQIVGRALNAKLGRSDKGWEIAVTDVELTPKGKEIFGLEKMAIQQMHRDIVADFPEGAIPLGSNAVCTVQAMYSPGKYITVQGHPEFTGEIVTEVVTNRHNVGVFDDEMYADAIKRATIPHDGIAIARAFLKFLHEG